MISVLMMMNFPDPSPETENASSLSVHNPSGFGLPLDNNQLKRIFNEIEDSENISFQHVELVFVDEHEIVELNRKHLGRDYVTDIISFRYDDENKNQNLEGTLYCCAPRIAEQSAEFKTNQKEEFSRIFIHGLLHLIGYNDQTKEEQKKMTSLEDRYLSEISGL